MYAALQPRRPFGAACERGVRAAPVAAFRPRGAVRREVSQGVTATGIRGQENMIGFGSWRVCEVLLAATLLVTFRAAAAGRDGPPETAAGPEVEVEGSAPEVAAEFEDAYTGFILAPEMPYRAHLRSTGIFVNAFHVPEETGDILNSIDQEEDRRPVTVIICRGDQKGAVQDYRSACDQFIMEALFMTPSRKAPDEDDVLWPGVDHLVVNYLREVRKFTEGERVIVAVPMTAREILGTSRTRSELFPELEWMVYATIGADFDGIIWGHVRNERWWQRRLHEFETRLKRYAADLNEAAPVDWVTADGGQPCSALATQDRLFVLLLNPEYMKVGPDGKRVVVPVGSPEGDCTVYVDPPEGVGVAQGVTLRGDPVELREEGRRPAAKVHYGGGGAMLVFDLSRPGSAGGAKAR